MVQIVHESFKVSWAEIVAIKATRCSIHRHGMGGDFKLSRREISYPIPNYSQKMELRVTLKSRVPTARVYYTSEDK